MFDIAGSELLVIGIVALVVIGPKELPGLIRTAGNAMSKVRRMAAEFRGQFDEAMREAELDQAKKAFDDVNETARSATTTFNPLETIRNEIKTVKDEIKGVETPDAATQAAIDIPPPPPAPEPTGFEAPVTTSAAASPEAEAEAAPEPKPKRSRKKAGSDASGQVA